MMAGIICILGSCYLVYLLNPPLVTLVMRKRCREPESHGGDGVIFRKKPCPQRKHIRVVVLPRERKYFIISSVIYCGADIWKTICNDCLALPRSAENNSARRLIF